MNNHRLSAMAKSSWSLERWLDYLMAIHPSEIDMSLARVSLVYERLAMSWLGCTVITVGGTNGKGTTCRFIEMALIELGYSVGVYSSPHLNDYRERVRINNTSPSEEMFCNALHTVERARNQESLTYFEFGTLAALCMFKQVRLDFVILEVGLGGRLDATNIVDADLTVITSIGIDHQEYLGDSRESVAEEKAGIFRTHVPIVIGEQQPPDNLLRHAQSKDSEVVIKDTHFKHVTHANNCWSWHMQNDQISDLPIPKLPIENISTGLAALQVLGQLSSLIESSKLPDLVSKVSLPGRLQILSRQPLWIVDVAHNPQAAKLLVSYLMKNKQGVLYIIVGMMKDKAIKQTLSYFDSFNAFWFPVSLPGERAATAAELGQYLGSEKVVGEFSSVSKAADAVNHRVTDKDTVLVFGSFVTVADVLTLNRQGKI